jgi:hypothetical protein
LNSDVDSDSTNRLRRFHPQTVLDQLKEQNTIIYSYTIRPGICKDLHYGRIFFVKIQKKVEL